MQKPESTRTPSSSSPPTAECCTDLTCESGLRNRYFEGKRLTPDMFRVEQQYLNDRRRLLNRAIHGHGVVYGYGVAATPVKPGRTGQLGSQLQIGAGLALDECGRELLHTGRAVAMSDLVALDDRGRRIDLETLLSPPAETGSTVSNTQEPAKTDTDRTSDDDGKKDDERTKKGCWLLSVHYAEQRIGEVKLKDPCSCDRDEWDHVCETVRFSLRRAPLDDCCAGCDCELTCGCAAGGCCCDHDEPAEGRAHVHPPFRRGGCRCLCDHLTRLEFPACDDRLCEIEEPCARVWVDTRHGVALASVEVAKDKAGCWTIRVVDACGPRRLVKRNDLLFDLIRGCDLTYIADFGWKDWHRRTEAVDFDAFAKGIAPDDQEQLEYVTAKFWVTFSQPVRKDTLDIDCFSFTVLSIEREGKWRGVQRVPILRLKYIEAKPADPDHVQGAYLVVDGGWVEDALWGRGSVFYEPTWVEIEVHGDFILDCNGQPVDANAVGRVRHRTGNGTPGGTFLSTFQVGPRPPYKPTSADTSNPGKGAAS